MTAETVDKVTGEGSPTPYQLLPRLTDEEYDALKADIAEHGIRVPIDVDESGTVIDGHHRAWIAADLGVECPRRVLADLTDEQKRAHAIAANVYRRSLTRDQRREMVRRLRELGMSTRRIAEVAQVSQSTVIRDDRPEPNDSPPTPTRGADGKVYPHKTVVSERRRVVAEMLDAGASQAEISASLSVPKSTVADDAAALRRDDPPPSKSPADTPRKIARIAELGSKGYSSAQIADDLGIGVERVRFLARENGVEITADKVVGHRRRVDSTKVAAEIVATLEGLALPMRHVNFTDLDATQATEWANSLTESIRALNRFAKQMKELAQQ